MQSGRKGKRQRRKGEGGERRERRKREKETYDFGCVYPRTDDFESYFCVLLDDLWALVKQVKRVGCRRAERENRLVRPRRKMGGSSLGRISCRGG